jgi:hypothetical protein
MKIIITALFIGAMIFTLFPVHSQEKAPLAAGAIGINFLVREPGLTLEMFDENASYPRMLGLGLSVFATDSFAIEPKVFLYKETSDGKNKPSDSTSESESTIWGTSIGFYFYKNISNGLYLFTGPDLSVEFIESKTKNSSGTKQDSKTKLYEAGIIFGCKYMLNAHFGLYGKGGFYYTSSTYSYTDKNAAGTITYGVENDTKSFSLLSTEFGASFYF